MKKDILFIIPLYYTSHFIERFHQYLVESDTNYSYDVYLCCSNHSISQASKTKAKQYGYLFQERENFGGGEGMLWFIQNKSGIDLTSYKYIWYYEESCEPLRANWIDKLINDIQKGSGIVGWDWHFEARKRPHQIRHSLIDTKGNIMIANENTALTGKDAQGNPFNMTWDTPGYRDETFVVRSEDFIEFKYPDASDPFWQERNGVRGYGVRAERYWWDMKYEKIHKFKFHSPNIQWFIFHKYQIYPSPYNIYFNYFREIPYKLRISDSYKPSTLLVRSIKNRISSFVPQLLRTVNTVKKVLWYKYFIR